MTSSSFVTALATVLLASFQPTAQEDPLRSISTEEDDRYAAEVSALLDRDSDSAEEVDADDVSAAARNQLLSPNEVENLLRRNQGRLGVRIGDEAGIRVSGRVQSRLPLPGPDEQIVCVEASTDCYVPIQPQR